MNPAEAAEITVPMRGSPYWRMSIREVAETNAGLAWLRNIRDKNICKTFIFQDALKAYLAQPAVAARLEAL